MARKDRKQRQETRSQFRQFNSMSNRLHEMLRRLGEQEVKNAHIKLDQFQKLRLEFINCSVLYEKANNKIKFESVNVERAKLIFEMTSNKVQMQGQLKQMTALILKLNEKVKREKMSKNPSPKKQKYIELTKDEIDPEEQEQQMSPLQKQLEYKTLIVYTFEKTFFKLIGKERKEVNKIKRDINNNRYQTLEDFKKENLPIDRLLEEEREQNIEEKEILMALKKIDNMIEERMDNLLEGIKILNYNAISISDTLNTIHTKVLINLDKVEHNNKELKSNQKRLEEAAKYVSKPSCIMNVIIAVLLGLMGFLIVKLVWFS